LIHAMTDSRMILPNRRDFTCYTLGRRRLRNELAV